VADVGIDEFRYFDVTKPSRGHTPIYKIHKYFARRPHNQFRALIEHYSQPGDVILDCFAGGGVTLVEGLTVDRRVISLDLNPIASLVQEIQVTQAAADEINAITSHLAEELKKTAGQLFETECPRCLATTDYRWIERAYIVSCPHCQELTRLTEEAKAQTTSGRRQAGRYSCEQCSQVFASVDVARLGSEILRLRVRCGSCEFDGFKTPEEADVARAESAEMLEIDLLSSGDIAVPELAIPLAWDRQLEDALDRKGFKRFSDLFTPRNRIALGFFIQQLKLRRGSLSREHFMGALGQVSALIRYVNSMTFSTNGWMDGRPVAWAKHAYWTPNQFIEVNPFEYLAHRQRALRMWEADRRSRFTDKEGSHSPRDVLAGKADYAISCQDARRIEIPDSCVDAIITDPPFGSNVQYGELTHIWQVWLDDLNPYQGALNDLDAEILMHRKARIGAKSADDYETGLRDVFVECWRVLRPDGVLVFTFNNRSPDAWYAVMSAAFKSGFSLEKEGVHYLDEIKAYRDTAHLRFDTELQGDVLYTFRKKQIDRVTATQLEPRAWLRSFVRSHSGRRVDETALAIALHLASVFMAAEAIQRGLSREQALQWLDLLKLVSESRRRDEGLLETCARIGAVSNG
jgi:putative DNA methylase